MSPYPLLEQALATHADDASSNALQLGRYPCAALSHSLSLTAFGILTDPSSAPLRPARNSQPRRYAPLLPALCHPVHKANLISPLLLIPPFPSIPPNPRPPRLDLATAETALGKDYLDTSETPVAKQ